MKTRLIRYPTYKTRCASDLRDESSRPIHLPRWAGHARLQRSHSCSQTIEDTCRLPKPSLATAVAYRPCATAQHSHYFITVMSHHHDSIHLFGGYHAGILSTHLSHHFQEYHTPHQVVLEKISGNGCSYLLAWRSQ